jgi:hypothetical protein
MPTEPEVPAGSESPAQSETTTVGPALAGQFARGALESAAHILGSASASVFAAGLVLPYIAAMGGPKSMDGGALLAISTLALVFSMLVGLGAVVLRGLAHCAPHSFSRRTPAITRGDAG